MVGAASIVDRSGGAPRFDVPFASLLDVELPTYEPDACPLCAQGLPVVKPGSRPVAVRLAGEAPFSVGPERLPDASRHATFKITLAYDGTDFVGWQRQAAGVSIQGLLEDALGALDERPVTVIGAGQNRRRRPRARPGGGVHARAADSTPTTLVRALNARLPAAIRVVAADEAPPTFHPRFTRARRRIATGSGTRDVLSPFERAYAWHMPGAARRRRDGAPRRGCSKGGTTSRRSRPPACRDDGADVTESRSRVELPAAAMTGTRSTPHADSRAPRRIAIDAAVR